MTNDKDNALGADAAAVGNDTPVAAPKRQAPNRIPTPLGALKRYVRSLETQTPRERGAAICWLASRYLGVRLILHEDLK